MVLDNLFPVFALLLFGHLLKRVGITHDAFLKTADKLIYTISFSRYYFFGKLVPPHRILLAIPVFTKQPSAQWLAFMY
jgi:hypothetical protein